MRSSFGLSLLAMIASSQATARSSDDELSAWRSEISTWAPVCEGAAAKADCDDGDSTLWNGLLCFSGETWACDAVLRMQSSDGRVWRSPRRVGHETDNTFSRDMAFGAMLYIVTTGDREFGEKWSKYIRSTGKLCPSDNDNRCNVTVKIRETFNRVADGVGFERLPLSIILGDRPLADDLDVWLAAKTESTGYTLHLVAMHILVRSHFGDSYWLRAARETLVKRQPANPFFLWLAEPGDAKVRQHLADQVQIVPQGNQRQWSFERDTAEAAWLDSMGWEFIFLINLLLPR